VRRGRRGAAEALYTRRGTTVPFEIRGGLRARRGSPGAAARLLGEEEKMNAIEIRSENELDFEMASALSEDIAQRLLGDSACLSWYDKLRDHECPAGVSECHDVCEIPGYVEYAETRGAQLKVDVNQGTFVFCFRSVAEFG